MQLFGWRVAAASGLLASVLIAACSPASVVTVDTNTPAVNSSPSPNPTASASLTGAVPAGFVPAGFVPASVTFVSPQTGWVLGTAPCRGATCLSLLRTNDGGRTWSSVPTPPVGFSVGVRGEGVSQVRFADTANGWAFGPDLWATHDGGGHWARPMLAALASTGAGVVSLEAAAGVVHAAVLDPPNVLIESSRVAGDSWQSSPTSVPLGAGPVPTAQLVLSRNAGWLIEVDRTVIDGARLQNGRWVQWQPPCAGAGGGAVLSAASPTALAAVCDEGVWSGGPEAVRAYFSTDGGASFSRARTDLPNNHGFAVASPRAGIAVVSGSAASGTGELLATFDGGATWTAVYHGQPSEAATYLGFTSSTQGVAITREGAAGSLLMTFNGGRSWSPVAFTAS